MSVARALLAMVAAATVVPHAANRRIDRDAQRAYGATLTADSAHSPLFFFAGRWSCTGGTPGGRVLVSDVAFTPAMNGRWLEVRHLDHPPGRYESLSVWPLGTSEDSTMSTFVYDNFGGARHFTSDGWYNDRIVWVRDTTEVGARMETFTYLHVSTSSYWYAWHVRRRPGTALTLGDSATCRRS